MVMKPSIAMVPVLVFSFISFVLLPSSLSSSLPSSFSFSLSYRDAQGSPLRSPSDAELHDLPEGMPMRDYIAAGMAMRRRIEQQMTRRKYGRRATRGGGAVVGKFTYLNEIVGDFYLTVPVGNPPQRLIFTLDTGSELTWTQCTPCTLCSDSGAPSFSFSKSSSYEPVPCKTPLCTQSLGFSKGCNNSTGLCIFQLQYGDGSRDAGYIFVDYLHFSRHVVKPIVLGCAIINEDTVQSPSSGIMGLNAGPFSFTSQLFSANPHLPKKFAYCLPDRIQNMSSSGTIELGRYTLPVKLKYTPLAPPFGPLGSLYYYVKLEGLSVGSSLIKAPSKEMNVIGEGGTIFDSGTALSYLVSSMYRELVRELRRQTASLHPFSSNGTTADVCYKVAASAEELPKLPKVTLHFAGMVDLELGPESVLYPANVTGSSVIVCLAFADAQHLSAGIPLNIIGNYQQQNYWVEYNLQTSSLGLAKANCAN